MFMTYAGSVVFQPCMDPTIRAVAVEAKISACSRGLMR